MLIPTSRFSWDERRLECCYLNQMVILRLYCYFAMRSYFVWYLISLRISYLLCFFQTKYAPRYFLFKLYSFGEINIISTKITEQTRLNTVSENEIALQRPNPYRRLKTAQMSWYRPIIKDGRLFHQVAAKQSLLVRARQLLLEIAWYSRRDT